MVKIRKEKYEKLIKGSLFLECLKACGVDNWIGYSDAIEMMKEDDEE